MIIGPYLRVQFLQAELFAELKTSLLCEISYQSLWQRSRRHTDCHDGGDVGHFGGYPLVVNLIYRNLLTSCSKRGSSCTITSSCWFNHLQQTYFYNPPSPKSNPGIFTRLSMLFCSKKWPGIVQTVSFFKSDFITSLGPALPEDITPSSQSRELGQWGSYLHPKSP